MALDLQGISATQAQALQTDLEATQQKLEAADYTDLTKQQLVGDLLYSTILSYFALNNVQDRIAERQANSVGFRAPSYGLFKTSLTPQYWYGIPRKVKADGLGMDVDRFINQRVDKNNNTENWIAFNRAQGARMSAMEHLVPEQMFSTEEAPAQGISTVKAIQLAAAQGQKIYTITQDNLNVALQQIELPLEIESEIRDAVGMGLEVIAHHSLLSFANAEASGYVMLDPVTGAGAYRISSGENGGWMKSAGGGGVIGSAIVALVFTGLPAATAAAFTASMALLMFGAILLLAAFVQLQDGNVVAAEILCGLGITFLIAALSFLPSVMNKLVQLLIAIFGFSIGYAGCSFK